MNQPTWNGFPVEYKDGAIRLAPTALADNLISERIHALEKGIVDGQTQVETLQANIATARAELDGLRSLVSEHWDARSVVESPHEVASREKRSKSNGARP